MNPTLLPPRPAVPNTRLSLDEYHRWEGYHSNEPRTELIRGFVLARPVSSPQHTFFVRRLNRLVKTAAGSGLLVRKEESMTLVDSEPQPDLAVVDGEENDFRHVHPTTAKLVMEISVSSERRDRDKLALYAEAEIPEYWLVLPEEKLIEMHTAPLAGQYTETQIHGAGQTFVSSTLPGLRVPVDELFRG